MNKKLLFFAVTIVLAFAVFGCHKKEVQPPPPPPPPAAVEKQAEPAPVDSAAIRARERARRLAEAKSQISGKVVYFDYDKSDIRPEFRSTLDQIAQTMKDFDELQVRVEGHCDERGTDAYNLALGERRANAARQYLVDSGISAGRIELKSWGEERPADAEHNEAAWEKNRRGEFIVLD